MRAAVACAALLLLAAGGAARAELVDVSAREVNVKLVYCGPPSAALHENLAYAHEHTRPDLRSKLTRLDDSESFDFLPDLRENRGFMVRFHLHTFGKRRAEKSLLLKGADGVVFVVDSDPAHESQTVASWASLKRDLQAEGRDWQTFPLVVQIDQRDRPGALSAARVRTILGLGEQPVFEAEVNRGLGVFDTLKGVAKLALVEIKQKNQKK